MTTEVIWSEFGNKLKGFIRSKVNDTSDAEDLLQEVFIKIHSNISKLSSQSKLESWVYQITRNSIVDYYRKKSNQPITEDVPDLECEDEELDKLPGFDQFVKCLGPFIESLSEKESHLLKQVLFDGVSQKEYAESYQENYSAVKSRFQRAREKLKSNFHLCCISQIQLICQDTSEEVENCHC